MSGQTTPEAQYKPPPESACDVQVLPIELTETDRLHIRMAIYRGKIVDFAIMQLSVRDDGEEVHVARIDCCHGTVHRHQYDRRGRDVYERREIVAIPATDGWEVVDAAYAEASETMFNEWEENLRRWRQ
ncbi:DUF7718 family protein [Georgenia satyanarayanai]|uniref:DUF7718 family protein n=1 Tax=Georgenia satyanarayanai TaxID=860221 RepID=UPI0011B78A19|nr:hypothetical protein [Georgenia satyanarayanai]